MADASPPFVPQAGKGTLIPARPGAARIFPFEGLILADALQIPKCAKLQKIHHADSLLLGFQNRKQFPHIPIGIRHIPLIIKENHRPAHILQNHLSSGIEHSF